MRLFGAVTGFMLVGCVLLLAYCCVHGDTKMDNGSSLVNVTSRDVQHNPVIGSERADQSNSEVMTPWTPYGKIESKASLPVIADSVLVYKINYENLAPGYVNSLADIFGFNTTNNTNTNGFREKNNTLEFFVTGGFSYTTDSCFGPHETVPVNLPGKEEAIKIAREFLEKNHLLPDGVCSVAAAPNSHGVYFPTNNTSFRWNVSWSVGFGRMINGTRVTGPGQKLGVTVGDNGEIEGVYKAWRSLSPDHVSKIKTPDEAFGEFVNRTNTDVDVPWADADKVLITNVSLAYYIDVAHTQDEIDYFKNMTGEDVKLQEFAEPMYIFTGDTVKGDFVSNGSYTMYVRNILKDG